MIKFLAYPINTLEEDVEFRVLRQNNRGTLQAFDVDLCMALAKKRNGRARKGAGMAMVANANGVRAMRGYYVDVLGDFPAIYGADGEAYKTVCDAVRTFFGFVPGGERCGK